MQILLVLGDQLDRRSPLFANPPQSDEIVCFAEVLGEVERFANHMQRAALFLSGMRHFAEELARGGWTVDYARITDTKGPRTLGEALERAIERHRATRVRMVEAGEWAIGEDLAAVCRKRGVPLDVLDDPHFLCSRDAFAAWAKGRRSLLLETFYRHMRKTHRILLEPGGEPAGGAWNFDHDNRSSFGKAGPGGVPELWEPSRSTITEDVLSDLEKVTGRCVGNARPFLWPVTPAEARAVLDRFIAHGLPSFGTWQDAMWTGEGTLFHSLLSPALNLKLIDPRDVIDAAIRAWERGDAPLNAVEGFVRQILGWREYIRGVYWLRMPEYLDRNALDAQEPLPALFWTGQTEMRCMREVVEQLLRLGYAHHIQRLMVAGLFAQVLGVRPIEVHEWFMAYYVDAVEWVTAPNVIGMSQYADGGDVGTKPYVATGRYVDRQSNYCAGCRFDPGRSTGPDACPITTLYWDFLARHRDRFASHPRMALQVRNVDRKSDDELTAIRARAEEVRRLAREGAL